VRCDLRGCLSMSWFVCTAGWVTDLGGDTLRNPAVLLQVPRRWQRCWHFSVSCVMMHVVGCLASVCPIAEHATPGSKICSSWVGWLQQR
jgi:hypothetical protein